MGEVPLTDRTWTTEELAQLEERDDLAMRNFRGELSIEEIARLSELESWLDGLEPPAPGLPQEVLDIIEKVLGPDR